MRLLFVPGCIAALLLLSDQSWGWTITPLARFQTRRDAQHIMVPSSACRCGRPPHGHRGIQRHAVPGADIEQPPVQDKGSIDASEGPATAESTGGLATRGKKNEIDFTVAPADVSLSRAYGPASTSLVPAQNEPPAISLTLALNNASNRAVRRIILARSWPSAEALNASLRQVAEAERRAAAEQQANLASAGTSTAKCPVPRPILNVLTRKRKHISSTPGSVPKPRSRTDEEYVADQLRSFRDRYGDLPKYEQAEDYLAAVLSLATTGVESERAQGRLVQDTQHIYHASYKRLLGVLKSAGVVFETDTKTGLRKITERLSNNDICLSMLDRIQLARENTKKTTAESQITNNAQESPTKDQNKATTTNDETTVDAKGNNILQSGLNIFKKDNGKKQDEKMSDLTREDLGGVLLSAEEPSMTRQLNVLSNIVLRALLFGGDQELLVLAETLDADRAAFVQRWYPDSGSLLNDADLEKEPRPGVQYLNCLVDLLRNCYNNGVMVDLQPSLPLTQSYANAYERLVAMAVELGSGYLKPMPSSAQSLPKPRTAKEELGRLALWESRFRQSGTPDISPYPEDMEGVWEVRDEFGGETIGTTKVTLGQEGQVTVDPPVEGLRWRLDPGPTHLDTCTFQVLNTDGTILQYRGFIDRGARLEARFSKRPMRIRGSVMFQMRDGSVDYYKDILPINYREGTTKFVMTKIVGEDQ